ncbi:hypothetical protein AAFF_G00381730 [Aldrovandia affinis]|uniref:Uncharacterized protein n=1 Tax=Aldrovandia affinis TaxID=143900 RepID=A0AAD7T9R1_9TELE|nr:hypothetical protein AAFF_G00381730 [Aldrovandia affinis]
MEGSYVRERRGAVPTPSPIWGMINDRRWRPFDGTLPIPHRPPPPKKTLAHGEPLIVVNSRVNRQGSIRINMDPITLYHPGCLPTAQPCQLNTIRDEAVGGLQAWT